MDVMIYDMLWMYMFVYLYVLQKIKCLCCIPTRKGAYWGNQEEVYCCGYALDECSVEEVVMRMDELEEMLIDTF